MVTFTWSPLRLCTLRRSNNESLRSNATRSGDLVPEVAPGISAREVLAFRCKALGAQLEASWAQNKVLCRRLDGTVAEKDACTEELLQQLEAARAEAGGYCWVAGVALAGEAAANAKVKALQAELDAVRHSGAAQLRADATESAAAAAGEADEVARAVQLRLEAAAAAVAQAAEAEQMQGELDALEVEVRRLLGDSARRAAQLEEARRQVGELVRANAQYAEQVEALRASEASARAAVQQAEAQASASEDMVAALSQTLLDFEVEVARLKAELAEERATVEQQATELSALEAVLESERTSNSFLACAMAAHLHSARHQQLAELSARHAATTATTATTAAIADQQVAASPASPRQLEEGDQQQQQQQHLAPELPELHPRTPPRTKPPPEELGELALPPSSRCVVTDERNYVRLHLVPSPGPNGVYPVLWDTIPAWVAEMQRQASPLPLVSSSSSDSSLSSAASSASSLGSPLESPLMSSSSLGAAAGGSESVSWVVS